MKFCNKAILFVSIFIASGSWAYTPREGNVNVNFGPFLSKTRSENSTSSFDTSMSSFGLVTVGDINSKGALEIGIFHFHKSFLRNERTFFVSEKTEMLHVTMGYRWWLSPVWSSSMTFSSSYSMGTPSSLYNDFPITEEIPTSARDTVEYGLDLALQREVWSQGQYGVNFDFRYGLSLTSKTQEQGDHFGAMVNFRYLIQEKYGPDQKDLKKDQQPGVDLGR